jgi:hypothetical protein
LRQIMRVKCADSRVEELDFVNDLVNGFHALDWLRIDWPTLSHHAFAWRAEDGSKFRQ